ncbi:MAG: class I SAM-dependent methyltransferase [Dongiaceae bacterium]
MSTQPTPAKYNKAYADFNSPLMRAFRAKAYGVDIGQHSWTSAHEIETIIAKTKLSEKSVVLDAGCGPGGTLLYALSKTGCQGYGIDITEAALDIGKQWAQEKGLSARVNFTAHDLTQPLPYPDQLFDVTMSIDVIVHLPQSDSLFTEAKRVLKLDGRLIFTDAGIITGPVQVKELERRSFYGSTRFTPDGYNEQILKHIGFTVEDRTDTTDQVVANTKGRIEAREFYKSDLLALEGQQEFDRQQEYLKTVLDLSTSKRLSRFLYIARKSR